MKNFRINQTNHCYSLQMKLFQKSQTEVILLVGGYGDTRYSLSLLAEELIKINQEASIACFSFRGVEEKDPQPLKQQVIDLEEIIYFLIQEKYRNIKIVCNSMGAFSTTYCLFNPTFKNIIRKVIYIDPADYYLKDKDDVNPNTWNGFDVFDPFSNVASDLLKNLDSSVLVDVVHFTLRNYSKSGYVPSPKRHLDQPGMFARLNTNMVRRFIDNLPDQNKGKYIENKNIPHAFLRDGNVERNIGELVTVIESLV